MNEGKWIEVDPINQNLYPVFDVLEKDLTQIYGSSVILKGVLRRHFVLDQNFIYPYYLNVMLTSSCNCYCRFCSSDSKHNYIPVDHSASISALHDLFIEYEPVIIALCGGEPLLYPNICLEYINAFPRSTIINILTNLNYELDDEHLAVFDAISQRPYSFVQTSIDTLEQNNLNVLRRGTDIDLICNNIRYLKSNLGIDVKVTVSEYNYSEVGAIILKCIDLNIDYLHLNYVLPVGRGIRPVSVYDITKIIMGLLSFTNLKYSLPFKEYTVSYPIEAKILELMFYGEGITSTSASADIPRIRAEQYVCTLFPEKNICLAGWEGAHYKSYKDKNIIQSFEDSCNAACSHGVEYPECVDCVLRRYCTSSTRFSRVCLALEIKRMIEILLNKSCIASSRERARNAVYDLLANDPKYSIIDLIMTRQCNGKCMFCQSCGSHPDIKTHFKPENFLSFIGKNSILLSITSGEPLLFKNEVIRIIKTIKKQTPKTIINLLTNMTLYDEEVEKVLFDSFGYYDTIQVSVYSHNSKKHESISGRNDWNLLNKNILKAVNAGLSVRANLTLTKDNLWDLEEICNHYLSLGVDNICINPLLDKGFARKLITWDYQINYIVAISKLLESSIEDISFSIPVEAMRIYHNILSMFNQQSKCAGTLTPYIKPNKLYIDYDGSVFDDFTREKLGILDNRTIDGLRVTSHSVSEVICQKCLAVNYCGGVFGYNNGIIHARCSHFCK